MTKRIMLVEDDDSSREALALLFQFEGFETIVAANGLEALKALDKNPDLIITDVIMPEMDGRQFVSKLKAQPKYADLPIICVSALSNPAIDANVILTKPVDFDTLLESINRCFKASSRN